MTKSFFSNPRQIILVLMAAILCCLASWQTAEVMRNVSLDNLRDSSSHTLNLVVENLRGELSQYRSQPRLLAANPDVKEVLSTDKSWKNIQNLNVELAEINQLTGALDTYLMDRSGLTIAASNWQSKKSFIGKNFNYRPYFKEAMEGGIGKYFALGTTSKVRGYYFAYPVKRGDKNLGAVVVKVDVGKLEKSWVSPDHEIIVTDSDGVVFLSSRQNWRFKALHPFDAASLQRLERVKRYPGQKLNSLGITERANFKNGSTKFVINNSDDGKKIKATPSEEFLVLSAKMPEADWNVHILAKTQNISKQMWVTASAAFFLLASLFFVVTNFYERRRRESQYLALQEKINAELEVRVKDRTSKLTKANTRLKSEVEVRRKTETELRQTQEDLVQASKLAALGQMSAGLSHELNQPLGAIRSYADNAASFLKIGEGGQAESNLRGISELTERMARIIKHLRTYARNEPQKVRPTSVNRAINEALGILQERIRLEKVEVKSHFPEGEVLVIGGDVRLQQVFVNLISNAIDAVQDGEDKNIDIKVTQSDKEVTIEISDTGSGIDNSSQKNIFDPFFTTKEVGQGMGLGLSITYGIIKQLHGKIEARNNPEGGALFRVTLQRAREMTEQMAEELA